MRLSRHHHHHHHNDHQTALPIPHQHPCSN
jgi:hypothetical protein